MKNEVNRASIGAKKTNQLFSSSARHRFLLLMLLTIFTCGNAWGTDATLTINYNSFTSHNTSYGNQAWSAVSSVGDLMTGSATVCFTNGQTYIQLKNGHPAFRNTVALPGAIKSVKLTRQSTGSNRQVTLYAGTVELTNSNYSSSGVSIGAKTVTTSGVTWTFTAAQISAGYKYFYFHGSSNVLNLDNAVITYEGTDCNVIDVTGGSTVILPKGSTTYSTNDWKSKGAPTAYPTSATLYKINGYCVTLTQVADFGDSDGIRFKASSGILQISGITSTSGIDVEILCSGNNGFKVELTGASDKTGQTGTVTMSTPSTSATLKISKNTANQGNIKYIKITPKVAASCSDNPTIGTASINSSFTLTSLTGTVSVNCSGSSTGSSSCHWADRGYVWSLGTITTTPTVSNNKVAGGTGDQATGWAGSITPSSSTNPTAWEVGKTYYIRAYGKNEATGADFAYGTAATFTLRSITYNSNGGSSVATQYVNSGGTYSKPTDPTKDGYTFGGWYTDNGTFANAMDWTAPITTNKELYAKWDDLPKYTVTLKDDNSTLTQASAGASVTLPSRTGCEGYTFAGWTKTWTVAQTSWTTTAPTIIEAGSYTPTADENLFPVYTKTEGGGGTTSKTLYYEPFTGSANASAVQSTNVAATTDMFTDASATVWSHYTFDAGSTTSYATNLDGDQMSNGTKILKQTNNTTVTMMEVTGIKITNATNMSLSLYNRRTYTSATLSISYKIDNGSYTAVGGIISYNSTNDKWKLCEGLTISGTGNSLSLKIELVVSGTTNRTMLLDDIKVTGTVPNSTTSYISVPDCCTKYDVTLASSGTVGGGTFSASPASACEGNTVTLSTDICAGYTVGDWTVTKAGGGTVTVTSNQFTMPAENVTVSLATTAKVDHFIDRMHNTTNYTGAGYAVSGCNKNVPTISDKSKGSECEGEHYKFVGWVAEDKVDDDGTLLTGYTVVQGGTTSWNASGTNYYAVWAKEE